MDDVASKILLPKIAISIMEISEKEDWTLYNNVFKTRDIETENIMALKKVRFINLDLNSVKFVARKIMILRKLDHSNIMKLQGYYI